jgi:uncharacterized protein (TIGR02147 family)
MKNSYCQKVLEREFIRRRKRNPRFSMRSYARFLGIGVASLSEALSGKRNLSPKNLQKVASKLDLRPIEQELFIQKPKNSFTESDVVLLEDEKFSIIADWYHFAIIELASIKKHIATPQWIGQELGIDVYEAQVALERLQKLNLIEIKNKKIIRKTGFLTSGEDIPSAAIRTRHHQILDRAHDSLNYDPIDVRFFNEITIAIDPDNIEQIKKSLKNFIRKTSSKLEEGSPSQVYSLSINLFPLKNRA